MNIKDQIRAEIERNRKVAHKAAKNSPDIEQKKFHEGKEFAYRVVGILLDSIPEQPAEIHIDNPNIEKIDPSINVETRTDGTGDIDGKALLYVTNKSYKIGFRDGKASKEQPVKVMGEIPKEIYILQSKLAPNSLGASWHDHAVPSNTCNNIKYIRADLDKQPEEILEEEIERFCEDMWNSLPNFNYSDGKAVITVVEKAARHFAEWGAR